MADVQIIAGGTSAAPLDYVVPGAQEIIVKATAATFDGFAAASSWLPAMQVISPGGKLVGTYLASETVAAGESADVSWFPGLITTADNGIRFNRANQGNWLAITTLGAAPLSGDGFMLSTFGGGGVEILSGDFLTLSSQQDGLTIQSMDSSVPMKIVSDGGMTIQDTSTGPLAIENTGGGDVDLTTTGGGTQHYQSADGFIWLSVHTGGGENVFLFNLSANDAFTVKDHNGNAILLVEENGPAYHIKAGKVWVADL